jgi:eukaryotic-like serine/threonine-protein kinase
MSRDGSPSSSPNFGILEGVPRAGEVIAAKYEVERVLGAGGMGVVVAARHMQLGQRVAIKFIRGEAASDHGALGRFLREARAAVALSSEHVTKVLDVGTLETGAPYMVMEYLEGEDLAAWLKKRGPMPVRQVVDFVLQACEALAEAHATGIVHRDLKPSNLFVTRRRDGSALVKVLDFGISKITEFNTAGAQEMLTASGLVMGSPGYMSPEQVRNAKAADARSDIWALGVILYELLSGISPFMGDTLGDTFARIVSETPVPIRQRRPEVPEGLASAITQCWQRQIDRRTQSVGALAEDLLPFASREQALSVERIRRISDPNGGRGERSQETLMAPETLGPAQGTGMPSSRSVEYPETGRAWLKSGARDAPRSKASPVLLVAVAGGIVTIGIAAAVVLVGHTPGTAPPAPISASQAPGPTALPAPSPVAPPVAAPLPPVGLAPPPFAAQDVVEARPDAGPAAISPPRATPKEAAGPPRPRPAQKPAGDPALDDLLDRRQ